MTGGIGRELAATENLKSGAVVEKLKGPIVGFEGISAENQPFAVLVDDNKWLLAEGNARYLNHACTPNCRIAPNLDVVTMQPVSRGEVLTIGYTAGHNGPRSDDGSFKFECRCGSAACMGTVGHIVVPRYDTNGTKIEVHAMPGKGRGIFAGNNILKDDVIERSPVILIPEPDWAQIQDTILYNYVFEWGSEGDQAALALGHVSLYNHSYKPNALLVDCLEDNVIEVVALRDIERGEEIVVNYNGEADDQEPLWFTVV